MSRLQDVINSLVKIIVTYTEKQKPTKNYIYETLITLPKDKLFEELTTVISEGTDTYPLRKSLMYYYLEKIKVMKPLIDSQEILQEPESEKIKAELFELLKQVIILLKTQKSQQIQVGNMSLSGFCQSTFRGQFVCYSGQLTEQSLLSPFGLTCDSSDDDIQKSIKKLFDEDKQLRHIKILPTIIEGHKTLTNLTTKLDEEVSRLRLELKESKTEAEQTLVNLKENSEIPDLKKQCLLLDNELSGLKNSQSELRLTQSNLFQNIETCKENFSHLQKQCDSILARTIQMEINQAELLKTLSSLKESQNELEKTLRTLKQGNELLKETPPSTSENQSSRGEKLQYNYSIRGFHFHSPNRLSPKHSFSNNNNSEKINGNPS